MERVVSCKRVAPIFRRRQPGRSCFFLGPVTNQPQDQGIQKLCKPKGLQEKHLYHFGHCTGCTCSKLGTIGWSAVFLCMALFENLIGFSMPIILFASSLATALKAGDVALRWFVRRRQARAGVSLKPVERFLDGTKVRGHRLTLTRPTQGATGISFLTRGEKAKYRAN